MRTDNVQAGKAKNARTDECENQNEQHLSECVNAKERYSRNRGIQGRSDQENESCERHGNVGKERLGLYVDVVEHQHGFGQHLRPALFELSLVSEEGALVFEKRRCRLFEDGWI